MFLRKTVLALAGSAALLSACGGGGTATQAQPQAADARSGEARLRALAATRTAPHGAVGVTGAANVDIAATSIAGVPFDEAARQLMNHAENTYRDLFAFHAETRVLFPFRYRYYPGNGVYLGVVAQTDPQYVLNGVYVMGGTFGSKPVFVGMVTDFITPAAPTGGPTSTTASNGCIDPTLHEQQGTNHLVSYAISEVGSAVTTATYEDTIGGVVAFEGQQARERTQKISATLVGTSTPETTETKFYYRKTGEAELTHYGRTARVDRSVTIGGNTQDTRIDSRSLISPAYVDREGALLAGQAITRTLTTATTATTTTTTSQSGAPPITTTTTDSSTGSVTESITYVGRAVVDVPAGSFETCLYEQTTSTVPNVTVSIWRMVGTGVMVRKQSSDGSVSFRATSVRFNGQLMGGF